jgi:hypothetical protein
MVRSVRWFGVALIAAALASAADAQTPAAAGAETPMLHARAHHHAHRRHVARQEPEGRQITVHKSASATPSWLTLGTDAPVGTGNNYVTSTFDQPSTVEGTFSGFRGRERLVPGYGVPGAPLFRF